MPSQIENLISIALEAMLKYSVESIRARPLDDQVRITLTTRDSRLSLAQSHLAELRRETQARGTPLPLGDVSSYQEIYTDQSFQCRIEFREVAPAEPDENQSQVEEKSSINSKNETRWDYI